MHLDVRKAMLGDEGFIAIASCLNNVEELRIGHYDDRDITSVGVKVLCESIKNRHRLVSEICVFRF